MTASFDRLCQILETTLAGDETPGTDFSVDLVEGEEGKRTAEWSVTDIQQKWKAPLYLMDILQEGQLPGNLLFHNIDKADGCQEHTMIIGDVSNPHDSWAIKLTCELFEDDEGGLNDPSATVEIIEEQGQIKQLVHDSGVRVMSDAAYEIIRLVREATNGERGKLDTLREALNDAGGDDILNIWKAQAQAEQLGDTTKSVAARKPKGPGRL